MMTTMTIRVLAADFGELQTGGGSTSKMLDATKRWDEGLARPPKGSGVTRTVQESSLMNPSIMRHIRKAEFVGFVEAKLTSKLRNQPNWNSQIGRAHV